MEADTKSLTGDNHTPTEDLLLCEHPQIKSLIIITGGSFNGYKCVSLKTVRKGDRCTNSAVLDEHGLTTETGSCRILASI